MSVSRDHIVAPVGQKRNVSGSPRCWYTSLVTATWAWAKELKVCLSAGHISVSMSSKSKEKDLQPNSFTWTRKWGQPWYENEESLSGSSNNFRNTLAYLLCIFPPKMHYCELSKIYYSSWDWTCSSVSTISSLLTYLRCFKPFSTAACFI